eukprot:826019-Amphidinium_carterae.1
MLHVQEATDYLLRIHALRFNIAVVPQDCVLLQGSLKASYTCVISRIPFKPLKTRPSNNTKNEMTTFTGIYRGSNTHMTYADSLHCGENTFGT